MSTVVLTETWTGSDSSAWGANWRSITADSGNNTTDIQGNRGRMQGVNGVHFFAWADTADVANVRVEFEFEPTNTGTGSGYNFVHIRSGDDSDTNGYRLMLQAFSGTPAGQILIDRRDGGSSTNLSTVGYSLNSSTVYAVIFEAIGTTIRYKVWIPASESEPAAWTASVTDSTHTTGAIGLHYRSNDSTTRTTWWDNLTITDLDGPLSVAYGSYVGDGLDNKAIATPFELDTGDVFVLVKCDASGTSDDLIPVLRLSNMPANNSKRFTFTGLITTAIKAFSSSGFTVGTHGSVNRSGNTYHWVALKAVGDVMKLLSYSGTGADNHAITGAGFAPALALTVHSGSQWDPLYRHTNMAAGESRRLAGSTTYTTGIKSLDADGFTLGTDALGNGSGVTFYAAVFKASAGNAAFGGYAGNGTSPRDITGFGLQPAAVFAQAATTNPTALKTPDVASTNALLLSSAVKTTTYITAILSDGMTVQSSLNSGSFDHVWWAFATAAAPAAGGHGLLLAMRRNRLVRTA